MTHLKKHSDEEVETEDCQEESDSYGCCRISFPGMSCSEETLRQAQGPGGGGSYRLPYKMSACLTQTQVKERRRWTDPSYKSRAQSSPEGTSVSTPLSSATFKKIYRTQTL